MYKQLTIFLFLFCSFVQARTTYNFSAGLSRYHQNQKSRFDVYPLGPSFLVSAEKTLEPILPLTYGIYFGMDFLSSNIMADGVENKLSQKNTNYGFTAKYSLGKKITFILGLGFSSVENELRDPVDAQSLIAYSRLFDLKSGDRSGVTTLGIQYNFNDRRSRNKKFLNFTKTDFKKFDATVYALNVGFSWSSK